eukprot:SAG31_NODE_169_length_21415_cov_29.765338_17_plen_175_part_00
MIWVNAWVRGGERNDREGGRGDDDGVAVAVAVARARCTEGFGTTRQSWANPSVVCFRAEQLHAVSHPFRIHFFKIDFVVPSLTKFKPPGVGVYGIPDRPCCMGPSCHARMQYVQRALMMSCVGPRRRRGACWCISATIPYRTVTRTADRTLSAEALRRVCAVCRQRGGRAIHRG